MIELLGLLTEDDFREAAVRRAQTFRKRRCARCGCWLAMDQGWNALECSPCTLTRERQAQEVVEELAREPVAAP